MASRPLVHRGFYMTWSANGLNRQTSRASLTPPITCHFYLVAYLDVQLWPQNWVSSVGVSRQELALYRRHRLLRSALTARVLSVLGVLDFHRAPLSYAGA